MTHPYIDNLIKYCEQAKEAQPIAQQEITSLDEISKLENIQHAVYIIKLMDADPINVFNSFSSYKSTNARACAKLNEPSKVLYVGSSTTGLRKRLKQHLDEGPKGTYALHMKHWFNENYKVEVMTYDVPITVLQIIEDSISYNLKPAFGKLGSNNK